MRVLTEVERNDAVGRVSQRGLELQSRLLQAQDVGEDVLVQTGDQLKLAGLEEETRFLQLDGDGHLPRARVNWEMRNLQTVASKQMLASGQSTTSPFLKVPRWGSTYSRYGLGRQDAKAPGGVLRRVELPSAEVELVR